ncbi:hypothetical protein CHS0354_000593 [Potamilus streckersoni]|uniref:Uncharacterized protein n=1 Tax=Potamilus streckersoni TaxID=2493646 RepID=A0AAE0T6Z9_9BIVA|nr:hypothetical protein CHS0354_000593 [Potamilus streckersoni]
MRSGHPEPNPSPNSNQALKTPIDLKATAVTCNSVGCSEESAAVSATTQDLNIEVNENVANANKGTLRYKWESASPGSDVFDDYNVTQSAFLLTRGAITLAINGKRFRCVVSNEEDSVTSSVVTLTVNPQGNVTTHAGNVTTHAGNSTTHAGNVTTHAGNVTTHAGNVTTHAGNSTTHAGNSTTHAGNAVTPTGNAITPTGNAITPTGNAVTLSIIRNYEEENDKKRFDAHFAGRISAYGGRMSTPTPTFTVTLNANKGTFGTSETATVSVESGKTVPTTTGLPSRANHTILKWNTQANGTGTNFVFGETSVTANITIYAQWDEVWVVSSFVGGIIGSDDGTGADARFRNPSGIGVDGSGNIYVSDFVDRKIRKITSTGVVTTLAGSGAKGSTDGTGTAASFKDPNGIAVDGSGNIYVTDYNHKIRKIVLEK